MAYQWEIDAQNKRQRLWDELSFAYSQKADTLKKEYAKTYSQAGLNALAKGMQRSSYNAQTLANIDTQKVEALNANEGEKMAAYSSGLREIDAEEAKMRQWQQQFDLEQERLAFEREQAAQAQANWEREFEAQQAAAEAAEAAASRSSSGGGRSGGSSKAVSTAAGAVTSISDFINNLYKDKIYSGAGGDRL